MAKDSFVFYPTFLQIAETLTLDEGVIGEAMLAVVRYGILGLEYQGDNPIVKAVMLAAGPLINAAKKKRGPKEGSRNNPNGRRGKIPDETDKELIKTNSETNSETKEISNSKLIKELKITNNVNVDDNVNANVNVMDKCAGNFQGNLTDTAQTIDEKKNPKRAYFKKPTMEEVREYVAEKSYNLVDPEHFYDYYESVGWKVGKKDMKDWKRAIANWQRMEKARRPNMSTGVILFSDKDKFKNEKQGW